MSSPSASTTTTSSRASASRSTEPWRDPPLAPDPEPRDADAKGPTLAEAVAFAVAGPAFAVSLFLLRGSTPLLPSVFDALACLALAWGLAPLAERRFGPFLGTALRGAGALAATLVFFPRLAENLGAVTTPLALAIGGATLLQADARRERPHPALATVGAGLVLAGLGLAWTTAEAFPEPVRLRAALALGGALLVAGLAARLALLRTRARGLAPMPVGLVGAALLLSVYVSYRPLAAQHVNNLPLYEWTLAAGVALLLLGRLRRAAREHETAEAWSLDARRHAQDVRPVYDPRMTPLAAVFQRYLEHAQGFEEYRRALEQAHGGALPRPLTDTLEAARDSHRGLATPKARRDARERRLAAHRDVLARL